VIRPFERLPADLQLRLLKFIEMDLGIDRRPDRVAALLAVGHWDTSEGWHREVNALVFPLVNSDPILAWDQIMRLGNEHGATPLEVTRAVLRHHADWPSLDAAGRSAAIQEERADRRGRELAAVLEAILAWTGPFSGVDLGPPLRWSFAMTQDRLKQIEQMGFVRDTGDKRTGGWHVYDRVTSEDSSEVEEA
jgi:hypothetical protein